MRYVLLLAFAPQLLPAQAATTDTVRSTFLMAGRTAGIHKAWIGPDGSRNFYFEFNDRGRGPRLTQRVMLDANGFPTRIDITGNDYLKSPVEEHFVLEPRDGKWRAAWKNPAESASVTLDRPVFYSAMYDVATDIFEPLLLSTPNKQLPMLPQGEARLERIRDLAITAGGRSRTVTLYATHGFGFTPSLWWGDEQARFFAGERPQRANAGEESRATETDLTSGRYYIHDFPSAHPEPGPKFVQTQVRMTGNM